MIFNSQFPVFGNHLKYSLWKIAMPWVDFDHVSGSCDFYVNSWLSALAIQSKNERNKI